MTAQTEPGQFLISMMPVPWKEICYYTRVAPGFSSPWFGFIEKETDVICYSDFFWKRYDSYPIKKWDAIEKLSDLVPELYNAYLERFGEEKIWSLIYMTEELAGMSAAMYLKQCFWRLSKEEFRARVEKARRNGRLQKAIQAGDILILKSDKLEKRMMRHEN